MVKDHMPRRGLPSAGSHPTSRAHGERQLLQAMQRGRKEAVVDRPLVCSWLQRRLLQLSHLSLPLRMWLCPEAQLGGHTLARPHRTSLCWPALPWAVISRTPITLITHLLYSTGPPYFYLCMLMSTDR